MIEARQMESIEPLAELKRMYVRQTTAPLDGMWLCGFVPMATHYGFYDKTTLVGFCCVNDAGFLLQFFMSEGYENSASRQFESIVQSDSTRPPKVNGAFVSTAEPRYLSLCLDHFAGFEVNALMYQRAAKPDARTQDDPLSLTTIETGQLPEAVAFATAAIGAPEEWLTGYYSNLISRKELFGLWEDDRLIATGESRGYEEYQTEYADLGVIVAESERGKGLATRILIELDRMNESRGLKSICSTEKSNVAAQRAIARAGFFAGNRIIQFNL